MMHGHMNIKYCDAVCVCLGTQIF